MLPQTQPSFAKPDLPKTKTTNRLCSVNPAALVLIGAGLTLAVVFAAVLARVAM